MPRCTGCVIALADPSDHHALAAHVLYHLEHLEFRMTQFASDQAHLDADVRALAGIISQFEAALAALKAQPQAAGADFTALDQLIADGTAYLNPPAAPASEPDVSNVPSDAGSVVPPVTAGTVVTPADETPTGDTSPDPTGDGSVVVDQAPPADTGSAKPGDSVPPSSAAADGSTS